MIRRFVRKTLTLLQVNWYKTFRVNFALLPFNQAIKLPIVVFGRLIIRRHALSGKVIFTTPVKFGMVTIGRILDDMPIFNVPSRLMVKGTLIFNGYCIISHSANITVWPNGVMELGNGVRICSGCLLKSANHVTIGDFTSLTSGCFLMDTNVHFIKDVKTGEIKKHLAPIYIGKECWLTMNTSVMKGTVLPDYCITARGTLLNRDYSILCEPGSYLAGQPAKVILSGVQRIFNIKKESMLDRLFCKNTDMEIYHDIVGFDELKIDDLKDGWFKI